MFARFGSILTRVAAAADADAELLERYVRHRDEAAFATLVDRHGLMVMGACRRVLGDTHAAEDAFQAAFLVLARKAAGLSRAGALAGWLYGVARRVALKARSAPPPELLPSREPQDRGRDPLAEMTGREILAVLEEELHRLPTRHRLPVVLCCLEGLTLEEAAARLGCTTGALRGRLERGRNRLRARLTERGLAPAAVLGVAGATRVATASTLSPGLWARTSQAAINFASRTGPVPDGPRHLAEGVLHAMLTTKLKLTAIAIIAPLLLVPAVLARNAGTGAPTAEARAGDMTGEEPPPLRPGSVVTGRVLSEPGGKGVAGVVVTLWNGEGLGRRTARTDASGAYSFPGVEPGDHYRVWIEDEVKANRAPGTWSEWGRVAFKDNRVKTDDLFIELPQSLSGTVTDADTGKPVPGAEVNFSTADGNRDSITTDEQGRYRLFVPPREVDLYCKGTHDRYESTEERQQATVKAGEHMKGIDFKVTSAPPFTGLVVLPDGTPAKGVDVLVEMRLTPLKPNGYGFGWRGSQFRYKTDDEGRFSGYMAGALGQGGSKNVKLQATARLSDHTLGGTARAETGAGTVYRVEPLKVVLAKSSGVTVRVVNPDGKPVTDAKLLASNHAWMDTGVSGPVKHAGDGKYLMVGLIPGLEYHLGIQAPGLYARGLEGELTLKPGEVRELGDFRLEWWGKKAVPGLVKRLQGNDKRDHELAIGLLGEIGAEAADAVPALVEMLKQDPRNTVRFSAATTLGKIGPPAKAAVPDLIKSLREDIGGGVQREAATALGLIGDPSTLPAIERALAHADTDVRRAATEAIKRLEEAARRRPLDP